MVIDLKMSTKRVDSPKAPSYPCLYLDNKDVMKGMVIGEKGKATIEYMVSGSGLEVHSIEFDGMKKNVKKDDSHKEDY